MTRKPSWRNETITEKKKLENGIRRSFWLPGMLDVKAEKARMDLGLGRSGFYRFCVVEVLKQLLSQGPSLRTDKQKDST